MQLKLLRNFCSRRHSPGPRRRPKAAFLGGVIFGLKYFSIISFYGDFAGTTLIIILL